MAHKGEVVKAEVGTAYHKKAESLNITVDPGTFNLLLKELGVYPKGERVPGTHHEENVSHKFTPTQVLEATARALNPDDVKNGLTQIREALIKEMGSRERRDHFIVDVEDAIEVDSRGVGDVVSINIPEIRVSAHVGLTVHSSLHSRLKE